MKTLKDIIFETEGQKKANEASTNILEESILQRLINETIKDLAAKSLGSDDFDYLLKTIEKLQAIRQIEIDEVNAKEKLDLERRKLKLEEGSRYRVTADTWAKGLLNVGYIIVWVAVSHENVVPKMLNGLTR